MFAKSVAGAAWIFVNEVAPSVGILGCRGLHPIHRSNCVKPARVFDEALAAQLLSRLVRRADRPAPAGRRRRRQGEKIFAKMQAATPSRRQKGKQKQGRPLARRVVWPQGWTPRRLQLLGCHENSGITWGDDTLFNTGEAEGHRPGPKRPSPGLQGSAGPQRRDSLPQTGNRGAIDGRQSCAAPRPAARRGRQRESR